MTQVIDYIYNAVDKIEDFVIFPIADAIGRLPFVNNIAPHYMTLQIIWRILFYGFLACMIASLTGTKKYIDKKMRWAQR